MTNSNDLQIGDIVISSDRKKSVKVFVIAMLPEILTPYILLKPFTKHGYVSLDVRNNVFLKEDMLSELKQHNKYKALTFCPNCYILPDSSTEIHYLTNYILMYGLSKWPMYNDEIYIYKCRVCKSQFVWHESEEPIYTLRR